MGGEREYEAMPAPVEDLEKIGAWLEGIRYLWDAILTRIRHFLVLI
jgi:hypothetical protein